MAVSSHNELTLWFNALERATKMETIIRQHQKITEERRVKRDHQPDIHHPSMKMKRGVKPDQHAESQSKHLQVRCIDLHCKYPAFGLKLLKLSR